MIKSQGLQKRFRVRRDWMTAVDGIDFQIEPGQFVGYAGPNGAGKSTTVKMMSGILVPTAGSITVDGLVPWRERKVLARRMGVVFGQRSQLWWDLPLRRSFELVASLYRLSATEFERRLAGIDDQLNLGPLLDIPVRSLSLGQRMRSELAAAVLPSPKVLFLDEPTIGLDVEAKSAVRTFLAELNRTHGTTVVLTTHDLDDITQLCERLLIIDKGKLIYDGAVEGLKNRYGNERVLVLDLGDDTAVEIPQVNVTGHIGRRWLLRFDPVKTPAPQLVDQALQRYDVVDLALEEPDIEEIIRRIYRGEPDACRPSNRL